MRHEQIGTDLDQAGEPHDFEGDYDIGIDLRHAKRNLATILISGRC